MAELIVAPSLLSADFSNLEREIELVKKSKAKWIHFDVMDGHFVPNISFGSKVLADVSKLSDLFLDVHLMITDPDKYVEAFVRAGADLITFHYEVFDDYDACLELIQKIKALGAQVGISVKPKTAINAVLPLLRHLNLILVMSVEPGFGGQKFQEQALSKIRDLRKYIDRNHLKCLIEVDGGIDEFTGPRCREAGVDVLVAGSYLFGHADLPERVERLFE